MRERGLTLLDVQFMTQHLRRFGATEIPRAEYEQQLRRAIALPRSLTDTPTQRETVET